MMMTNSLPKIFCAIDTPDLSHAVDLTLLLSQYCGAKIGMEFFNAHGVRGIEHILKNAPDLPVFLDLKYHDIPNTVAGAIRAVTQDIKPTYLNVHASGGVEMMRAAKDACPPETKLLAVTVLTSLDADNLQNVGQDSNVETQVVRLARLAQQAGLDGVVCSAREIDLVREACGPDFILMVPGIRPAGSAVGDQKRVMTPKDAVDAGATHLVIGRPITQADDPVRAAQDILKSL